MDSILNVLQNNRKQAREINIYLAWQSISDGRKQIRRYSPNAYHKEIKLFEPFSSKAIAWLEKHNHPEWPACQGLEPYDPYLITYIGEHTKGTV